GRQLERPVAQGLRSRRRRGAPRGGGGDHFRRCAPRRVAYPRRLAARPHRLPPSRERVMSFASPIALLALLLVPLAVVGYVWFQRRREAEVAAFVQPALLPNVVDRVPGWRRHLPVAVLLLAIATFLLGFARPHATLSVRSEEAT